MTLQSALHESAVREGTTSSSGPAGGRDHAPQYVIVVSGGLLTAGTSSAGPTRLWEAPYVHRADTTVSGSKWDLVRIRTGHEPVATRKAISELRRISGLTWHRLGQLLGVSRRSVHYWASGKPLNADNQERLMRVLDIVRAADRGSARSTRAALLDVGEGTTPLDMLAARRFDDARRALGQGRGRPVPALAGLSPEARAARKPLPPEELYDAKSERVHREPGRARAARVVRNTLRGSD